MSDTVHANHPHQHGSNCGHTAIEHQGHVDYLHDGHMHHQLADGKVEEHQIPIGGKNPNACTPTHHCGAHPDNHVHGPNCGHPEVPHGDHVDYLVNGHLHHPHGSHCDDHGPVTVKS
jgi:hypothetical protein